MEKMGQTSKSPESLRAKGLPPSDPMSLLAAQFDGMLSLDMPLSPESLPSPLKRDHEGTDRTDEPTLPIDTPKKQKLSAKSPEFVPARPASLPSQARSFMLPPVDANVETSFVQKPAEGFGFTSSDARFSGAPHHIPGVSGIAMGSTLPQYGAGMSRVFGPPPSIAGDSHSQLLQQPLVPQPRYQASFQNASPQSNAFSYAVGVPPNMYSRPMPYTVGGNVVHDHQLGSQHHYQPMPVLPAPSSYRSASPPVMDSAQAPMRMRAYSNTAAPERSGATTPFIDQRPFIYPYGQGTRAGGPAETWGQRVSSAPGSGQAFESIGMRVSSAPGAGAVANTITPSAIPASGRTSISPPPVSRGTFLTPPPTQPAADIPKEVRFDKKKKDVIISRHNITRNLAIQTNQYTSTGEVYHSLDRSPFAPETYDFLAFLKGMTSEERAAFWQKNWVDIEVDFRSAEESGFADAKGKSKGEGVSEKGYDILLEKIASLGGEFLTHVKNVFITLLFSSSSLPENQPAGTPSTISVKESALTPEYAHLTKLVKMFSKCEGLNRLDIILHTPPNTKKPLSIPQLNLVLPFYDLGFMKWGIKWCTGFMSMPEVVGGWPIHYLDKERGRILREREREAELVREKREKGLMGWEAQRREKKEKREKGKGKREMERVLMSGGAGVGAGMETAMMSGGAGTIAGASGSASAVTGTGADTGASVAVAAGGAAASAGSVAGPVGELIDLTEETKDKEVMDLEKRRRERAMAWMGSDDE